MEEFFQKIKDKFEKSNISTINIIPKIKLANVSSKLSRLSMIQIIFLFIINWDQN